MGTNHPILKIAKGFLFDEKSNIQTWGLLILLISKAAGQKVSSDQLEDGGVLLNQRNLAELTELIKTGHLVHTGLLNPTQEILEQNKTDLVAGNKIALLTGDFLLVKANGMLSNLRNSHVNGLISSALRDLTDSEFVGERNPQNIAMPSEPIEEKSPLTFSMNEDLKIISLLGADRMFAPLDTNYCIGNPVREWTMRNVLSGGSLLGRGCESALHLAGHDQNLQTQGYLFGCHTALAWRATTDINIFTFPNSSTFSLVCAPVLFALHHDPSLYELIKPGFNDLESVDFEKIRKIVKEGSALDNTVRLLNEHSEAALKCLENFPNSDATRALRNIVEAMQI